MTEDRTSRRGFVVKMAICCTVCGKKSKIIDPYCEDDLEVNHRSVLASRVMGKGRSGLATFAGMMGMLPPLTTPITMMISKGPLKRRRTCQLLLPFSVRMLMRMRSWT